MDWPKLKKEINSSLADVDVALVLLRRLKKRRNMFREREIQALQALIQNTIKLNSIKLKEAKDGS